MKRLLALTLALAFTVFTAACAGGQNQSGDGVNCPISSSGNGFDGETDVFDDDAAYSSATVSATQDINEIPVIYAYKFAKLPSFVAETNGSTVADVLFISYTQKIYAKIEKSGDVAHYNNKSNSALVNTDHDAYFYGQNAWYLSGEEYVKTSLEDYLSVFGVNPVGRGIEGYLVTAQTVKSVELIKKTEADDYVFLIELDGEAASSANKVQMKKFGSLSDYPEFLSLYLTLTVKEDFSPVSIRVKAEYYANFLGKTKCMQDYTVTFTSVNEKVDIDLKGLNLSA